MRTRALRLLFLFADMSRQSLEAFQVLESEDCLSLITKQYDTDDVLELLAVVELLEIARLVLASVLTEISWDPAVLVLNIW